jgi:hypothetical protein
MMTGPASGVPPDEAEQIIGEAAARWQANLEAGIYAVPLPRAIAGALWRAGLLTSREDDHEH